jgi:hypothetical protein
MTNSHELFLSTSARVLSNSLPIPEALSIISSIDFNLFSFDDMAAVEDSDWIPDDIFVEILRGWISAQEMNLLQIRSYLALTATVSRELLLAFVDSIFEPHRSLSLTIDDVIYRLATGAGTRPYENPFRLNLITAQSDSETPIQLFAIENMFANDPNKFFQSQPKPNAQFVVGMPAFLQVAPTAYTLRGPAKSGSIRAWTFEGSVDLEKWVFLDNIVDNQDLATPGAEHTFTLAGKGPFCRWFRITQKSLNHDKNLALRVSRFDISGEVRLVRT